MAAVWLRARSQLRRYAGASVLLIVLIGAVAGVVLASVAGARRNDAALPAFVRSERVSDVTFFPQGNDAHPSDSVRAWLGSRPEVGAAERTTALIVALENNGLPSGIHRHLAYPQMDDGPPVAGSPLVVAGHLPDPGAANDIAIDEELGRRAKLGVGSQLRIGLYTTAQFDEAGQGFNVTPAG